MSIVSDIINANWLFAICIMKLIGQCVFRYCLTEISRTKKFFTRRGHADLWTQFREDNGNVARNAVTIVVTKLRAQKLYPYMGNGDASV